MTCSETLNNCQNIIFILFIIDYATIGDSLYCAVLVHENNDKQPMTCNPGTETKTIEIAWLLFEISIILLRSTIINIINAFEHFRKNSLYTSDDKKCTPLVLCVILTYNNIIVLPSTVDPVKWYNNNKSYSWNVRRRV